MCVNICHEQNDLGSLTNLPEDIDAVRSTAMPAKKPAENRTSRGANLTRSTETLPTSFQLASGVVRRVDAGIGAAILPRLLYAAFTRVLRGVTLPEATPVHEAARLQDDLLRAGITPYAWIINQSFVGDGFRDPVLVERGSREVPYLAEVRDRLATRFAVIPWKPAVPVGPDLLRELTGDSLAVDRNSKG